MRKIPEEEWESLQDERKDYEDIEELKDIIWGWLDDSIERDGFQEDSKVSSATTDDKFYFLIHDVVMTHPENTERQDLLFSIERVEGQNVRSIWWKMYWNLSCWSWLRRTNLQMRKNWIWKWRNNSPRIHNCEILNS